MKFFVVFVLFLTVLSCQEKPRFTQLEKDLNNLQNQYDLDSSESSEKVQENSFQENR